MRLRARISAAALLILACGMSHAQSTKNDPEAVELLQKMEQKYAQVQSVAGRFRQTRTETDGLGGDIISTAEFSLLKPNQFRADYLAPHESTNLITDNAYFRYTPKLKQVEKYQFKNSQSAQDLNYMLLGFGVKTEDVLKVYTVKSLKEGVPAAYQGIQLTPKDKKTANFEFITILITSGDDLRPAQFSMKQGAQRTTADLDLKMLKIGDSINSNVFKPNWPRGVETVSLQ